jgi:hypothetical protein
MLVAEGLFHNMTEDKIYRDSELDPKVGTALYHVIIDLLKEMREKNLPAKGVVLSGTVKDTKEQLEDKFLIVIAIAPPDTVCNEAAKEVELLNLRRKAKMAQAASESIVQ